MTDWLTICRRSSTEIKPRPQYVRRSTSFIRIQVPHKAITTWTGGYNHEKYITDHKTILLRPSVCLKDHKKINSNPQCGIYIDWSQGFW